MATAGWIFATPTASKATIPTHYALPSAVASALLTPPAALTLGVASSVVRALGRRLGVEGSEEAMQQLARRVSAVERRYGDEGLRALDVGGPDALRLVERAGGDGDLIVRGLGRHGADALRVLDDDALRGLVRAHGDDALEAMVRHPGIADDLIATHGDDAVRALGGLNGQNGRRLSMLDADAAVPAAQRSAFARVLETHGDPAMDFVWRNKGALFLTGAGTAALLAFLSDPQPFIDGTRDLAQVGADLASDVTGHVAGAATEVTTAAVHETGSLLNTVLRWVGIPAGITLTVLLTLRTWWRRRKLDRLAQMTADAAKAAGAAENVNRAGAAEQDYRVEQMG